jgi:hypothetical protein
MGTKTCTPPWLTVFSPAGGDGKACNPFDTPPHLTVAAAKRMATTPIPHVLATNNII